MEFLKGLVEETRKRKQRVVVPQGPAVFIKNAIEMPVSSEDTRSDASEKHCDARGCAPFDAVEYDSGDYGLKRSRTEYDEDDYPVPLSVKNIECIMQSASVLNTAGPLGGSKEGAGPLGGSKGAAGPLGGDEPPIDSFRSFIQEKKRNKGLISSLARVEKEINTTMANLYEKTKRHDRSGIQTLFEYIQHHSTINSISWRNEKADKLKCMFNAKVIGYYSIQIKSDPLSAFLKALREGRARADVYPQFVKDFRMQEYVDPDVPFVRYVRVSKEKLVEILALIQFNSYRLITSAVYSEEISAEEILEKFNLLKKRINSYSFAGLHSVE